MNKNEVETNHNDHADIFRYNHEQKIYPIVIMILYQNQVIAMKSS